MTPDFASAVERLTKLSRRKRQCWEQPYDEAWGVVVEPADLRTLLAHVKEPATPEGLREIEEWASSPIGDGAVDGPFARLSRIAKIARAMIQAAKEAADG